MFLAIAVLAAVLVAGCSDDDSPVGINGGQPELGSGAQVRAIHASPNAPAVDIYVKGVSQPVAANVTFGATTPYLDVAPGSYTIDLRGAGSPATSSPAYSIGPLTISQDDKITAIAMGDFTSSNASDMFRIKVYPEAFATPGAGEAVVRIVHASPDAPTVGLDVGDDGSNEVASLPPPVLRWTRTHRFRSALRRPVPSVA